MFVEQIEKTDLMAWFDPSFHGSNIDSCYTRQKSVWKCNAVPVKCLTHCTLVDSPTVIIMLDESSRNFRGVKSILSLLFYF